MKIKVNIWENSKADLWKPKMQLRVFTCSRILTNCCIQEFSKFDVFFCLLMLTLSTVLVIFLQLLYTSWPNFILYISDLPNCLSKSDAMIFADDTALFYSSNNPLDVQNTMHNEFQSLLVLLINCLLISQKLTTWKLPQLIKPLCLNSINQCRWIQRKIVLVVPKERNASRV